MDSLNVELLKETIERKSLQQYGQVMKMEESSMSKRALERIETEIKHREKSWKIQVQEDIRANWTRWRKRGMCGEIAENGRDFARRRRGGNFKR